MNRYRPLAYATVWAVASTAACGEQDAPVTFHHRGQDGGASGGSPGTGGDPGIDGSSGSGTGGAHGGSGGGGGAHSGAGGAVTGEAGSAASGGAPTGGADGGMVGGAVGTVGCGGSTGGGAGGTTSTGGTGTGGAAGGSGTDASDAGQDASDAAVPTLRLIQPMNLDGCFLTPGQIAADESFVYLASGCTPKLFIVSRAPAHSVETVPLPTAADSVGVDATSIYIGLPDTTALSMTKTAPHPAIVHDVGARWSDIFPRGAQLYAGTWQARAAVTSSRVFLASLNDGDDVHETDLATWTTTRDYATDLREQTAMFDRVSGAFLGSVFNPFNNLTQRVGVSLRADESYMYQTMPGCCGLNVLIYNQNSLTSAGFISRNFVDDVMRRDRWLFGGTEAGEVLAWDMQQLPSPTTVGEVNLRTLTGHTGREDIEIRAIWADEHDDLVFAASSWGNDLSRGPDLPSFFILRF